MASGIISNSLTVALLWVMGSEWSSSVACYTTAQLLLPDTALGEKKSGLLLIFALQLPVRSDPFSVFPSLKNMRGKHYSYYSNYIKTVCLEAMPL